MPLAQQRLDLWARAQPLSNSPAPRLLQRARLLACLQSLLMHQFWNFYQKSN